MGDPECVWQPGLQADPHCNLCGRGESEPGNEILLCDGLNCANNYHQQCCAPPVLEVPEGAWLCSTCVSNGNVIDPEVLECYTMTGIWDYILKIVTRDVRHYEDFVRNTLSASELIRELHSHIAVTEIKNTTALPLSTQVD